MLYALPAELLTETFAYCDKETLSSAARACKKFSKIVDEILWKHAVFDLDGMSMNIPVRWGVHSAFLSKPASIMQGRISHGLIDACEGTRQAGENTKSLSMITRETPPSGYDLGNALPRILTRMPTLREITMDPPAVKPRYLEKTSVKAIRLRFGHFDHLHRAQGFTSPYQASIDTIATIARIPTLRVLQVEDLVSTGDGDWASIFTPEAMFSNQALTNLHNLQDEDRRCLESLILGHGSNGRASEWKMCFGSSLEELRVLRCWPRSEETVSGLVMAIKRLKSCILEIPPSNLLSTTGIFRALELQKNSLGELILSTVECERIIMVDRTVLDVVGDRRNRLEASLMAWNFMPFRTLKRLAIPFSPFLTRTILEKVLPEALEDLQLHQAPFEIADILTWDTKPHDLKAIVPLYWAHIYYWLAIRLSIIEQHKEKFPALKTLSWCFLHHAGPPREDGPETQPFTILKELLGEKDVLFQWVRAVELSATPLGGVLRKWH